MDIIEQIGSYAGLASIVGLAVLAALYFSQARDVKRLREWAGRAPERAAQQQPAVPQRVVAQPKPAPVPGGAQAAAANTPGARPPVPQVPDGEPSVAAAAATGARPAASTPATASAGANKTAAPVPAAAGASKSGSGLVPATPAAASASGATAEDAPPPADADSSSPAPAGTPAAAAPASPQAAVKAPAAPSPPPQAAPAAPSAAGGSQPPPVPDGPTAPSGTAKPATPAGQARPQPGPASRPPSRIGGAPPLTPEQTAVIPPPGRPSERWRLPANPRYVLLAIAGVLIIGGGVAFGVAQLIGGEEGGASRQASDGGGEGRQQDRRKRSAVNPAEVTVAVLNGTTVPGLAAGLGDEVERFGFDLGTVDNALNQQSAESRVLYAPGHEREAVAVGRRLRIAQREAIDPGSRSRAGDATVVVIAGADQTP